MNRLLSYLGLGAATLLAFATQLPHPADRSNVDRALKALGIDHPGWATAGADNWVGGGALLVLAGMVFAITFLPRRRDPDAPVIAVRPKPPAVPGLPDLPIRDLFLLLAPGLDESPEQRATAEAAGRRLRHDLQSGALTAWGKPENSSRSLRPIAPAYWERAEWTYWFLPADAQNRDLIHATQPDGTVPLRDLHLNRAAVQALLAAAATKGVQRPGA